MRLSSLYRPIAPWHLASMWALGAAMLVFVTASISHGFDSGLRGGVATFLAWAITRELAPKRFAASLLAPFAAVAFAIPADTDLLSCFGVLVAARIASRSVGDPPTVLDCMVLVPFAAWLATRPSGLPVALVLAAVVFSQRPGRRHRIAGAAMLAVTMLVGSTEGTLTIRGSWDDPSYGAQVLLAVLAAAALVVSAWPLPQRLRVRDDRRRGALLGDRIRVARVVVVATLVAGISWVGSDAAFTLSAAAAALVAAALGGASLPRFHRDEGDVPVTDP